MDAAESCPDPHRPNLILLTAFYHCIHSLKIHFISNSSSHGSLFPVFLYDELCNGQARTCFMLKCHCFSKVDTNIWNYWLIVRQNRERAWLHSLKCQLLHHPDSVAFQPQTSPRHSISTSTWVHNPELTARRPPWGGRSEQHRHREPTAHVPGPLLLKHHNQEEWKRSPQLSSSGSLTLPCVMSQAAPFGEPAQESLFLCWLPGAGA